MTDTTRTKNLLGLLTAAALLTLAGCGGSGSEEGSSEGASESSESSESSDSTEGAGQPDVSDIPDVVAEVNGEEVSKEDFVSLYQAQYQQAAMQAQTSGQEPDEEALKKSVVDNLVDTELLSQEADSRGIEVSEEDVDNELTTLAEQNQLGSADELIAALEKQGTSEDQVRTQVETQVLIEGLVADESGAAEPTEKELRALYAKAKKQATASGQGAQIPPYQQVKAQLAEQVRTEQVGKVAQQLVDDLRKDADITVNL